MGCPLSRYSTVYDAHAKAHEYGAYFQLPAAPHIEVFAIDPNLIRTPDQHFEYGPKLLNRKVQDRVLGGDSRRADRRAGARQLRRAAHQRPRRRAGARGRESRRLSRLYRWRAGREERQADVRDARHPAGRVHRGRTDEGPRHDRQSSPGVGRPQEPALGATQVRRAQTGRRLVSRAGARHGREPRTARPRLRPRPAHAAPRLAEAGVRRQVGVRRVHRVRPTGRHQGGRRPRQPVRQRDGQRPAQVDGARGARGVRRRRDAHHAEPGPAVHRHRRGREGRLRGQTRRVRATGSARARRTQRCACCRARASGCRRAGCRTPTRSSSSRS